MERCQRLSKRILDDFHAIALPTLRHEAIIHTVSTANAATMLAMHRHLDRALCVAAAWLHDIALYTKNCRHGIHGEQSAELAVPYLEDAGFSTPEIEQITTAIRHHSHKERTDDLLSELLKDADILGRYLQDGQVPADPHRHQRLIHVMKTLDLL